MRQRLYWCVTGNGDCDYWVVAHSWKIAAIFFADQNGFAVQEVGVEHVTALPARLSRHFTASGPAHPSNQQLAACGVHYNQNFHVFVYMGRIYRPEGLIRALMCSHAKARNALRMRQRTRARERL